MDNLESKIVIFGANGAIGDAFVNHYVDSCVYTVSRKKLDNKIINTKNLTIQKFDDENLSDLSNKFENNSLHKIIVSIGMLHNDRHSPEKRIDDFEVDQFNEVINTNLVIPTLIAKYFHRKMRKDEPSMIAILSARVGSISDNRKGGWYSYRASKAGLNMIIRNLSIELKRSNQNIIVIGLHPGTVDSSLSQPFHKNTEDSRLFSPDFSVSKLSLVMDSLKLMDSGKCFAWDGDEILP